MQQRLLGVRMDLSNAFEEILLMLRRLLTIISLSILTLTASAQQTAANTTPVTINNEGGAVFISGRADYTFPYFRLFLPEPYITLYDIAGLVERDVNFVPSAKSQVFGAITSNPQQPPFTYELSLPAMPRGEFRDVDQDGVAEQGVMMFMVAVVSNMWQEPFLERRDNFVAGIIASANISTDIDRFLHLRGGKVIIYAPDDAQSFPIGSGTDGILFTADDPSAPVAQGYTIVDLSSEPFVFDRDLTPRVDLFEAEDAALDDLSDLGFTAAFDAAVDLLSRKYAFTDYKGIDWETLRTRFRDRVVEAEQTSDEAAYRRVLREFAWSIPDGHVSGPFDFQEFQAMASGGIGVVLRQLDDGRVIVYEVLENLPAARAGILPRAEVLEINGVPIEQALEQTVPWTSPFSTPHNLRLEQLRFVHRFPVDTPITMTYRNPDSADTAIASMRTEFDGEGLARAALTPPLTGTELPVEFTVLPSGYGLISIYSFSDDLPLTIMLWERAIQQAIDAALPGLIIDIRRNGGGSGYLGDQFPAYFFDQEYVIGNVARFSESRNEFVVNPELVERFIRPTSGLYYSGPVAVIISPNCASACEAFAFAMTINNRAGIIGHYPTAGLGGSVVPIAMPAGADLSYTITRSLGPDGEINIEGKGIAPTMRVPLTEETLFADRDVLLDAAVDYLRDANNNFGVRNGGTLNFGNAVLIDIAAHERVQFDVQFRSGQIVNIIARSISSPSIQTILRVYLPGQTEAVLENLRISPDDSRSGFQSLEIPADLDLIIEVGTLNDVFSGTIELLIEEVND